MGTLHSLFIHQVQDRDVRLEEIVPFFNPPALEALHIIKSGEGGVRGRCRGKPALISTLTLFTEPNHIPSGKEQADHVGFSVPIALEEVPIDEVALYAHLPDPLMHIPARVTDEMPARFVIGESVVVNREGAT